MPPRANVPAALTSFIGRERETAEVTSLLAAARLVTLTGSAGCGKTRLALRVAGQVAQRYEDGVHWVELASLADPLLVPQAIAKTLHLTERRDQPDLDGLLDALQQKNLLLVLDNCEHVLSACAQIAAALLASTDITVLATSREPLGVAGERRYPVSPLALPPAGALAPDAERFDAVRLFVERARAILPDFALTPANVEVVGDICRHLDGVPLAIELASAHVNVLTVEQIHERLDDRFRLLAPAAHITRSHHPGLRAAIDWSYDVLTPAEQRLLRRLAVFVAGFSLNTAESVCAGDGIEASETIDLLSSLVNKSLVVAHTLQRGEARYSLLETIRQYAQEKLAATGEAEVMRDRHLHCFLQLAEETAPKLSGPYQQLWLSWLEGEYGNLRAALAWSLERGQIEAGLRIAIAIYQFWTIRDYVVEGLSWVERLLERAEQARERVSPAVHANALAYAAFLTGFRGNTEAQAAYGREAARLAVAAGDEGKAALRWALSAQAYGARAAGDHQTELELSRRVIELNRELDDAYQLGLILSIASFAAMSLGELGLARTMLDEGLPLLRTSANPYRIAMALNFSGDLARCERRFVQAKAAYEESIALLREIGAVRDLASALQNLGHACLHLSDSKRAHALFKESLASQQAQRNTPGVAECLIGFAALTAVSGDAAAGARLLAAAAAIGGERATSAWAATRLEYEHYLALVRSRLTEAEFQAEQEAGRSLSLGQAVQAALSLSLATQAPPATDEHSHSLTLTARERDIAALVAQGRSNQQIADELVISKRTVEKHIANILSKLALSNRAQVVRWAIEAGLLKPAG